MNIGNIKIEGLAALAPMAGVADRAMREICAGYGAAFTVGELTSAKGVSLGDKKSEALLRCYDHGRPQAAQLFGCEPEVMAEAAVTASKLGCHFIDINMGCPAPKVAGNGGGSALMRDIPLAESIVKAVVKAVSIPVTVKMRTGWDENGLTAVELAKACESAGAFAITVHGRTRKQMYAPPVNIDAIAEVKKAVSIPVIGNGDVTDAESAKRLYEYTGCDLVMVGRAAMGNPFIFEEINTALQGKEYQRPSLEDRLSVCKKQIELMHIYKDPHNAILEARKHTAWYMAGLTGAAQLRRMCGEISSMQDVENIIEKALETNSKL